MNGILKNVEAPTGKNKLLFVLFVSVSVLLFVAYLLSAFRSPVNADAGYYLGVVELIHNGLVPYRDFKLGYTPLFFYVLQVPRLFMGSYPNYYICCSCI